MKPLKIYPKNKEYFKELIPFAKEIIKICKNNKITPVIYGSFAHFYHTRDENMKVNDIDILIPKKDFKKIVNRLKAENIRYKYYPEWNTIIIKNGKLKVEIDGLGTSYKRLKEKSLFKRKYRINFYGIKVGLLTLEDLEEMYSIAYKRSVEDKARIKKKIKHLEKFLGRKLK